MNTKTLFALAIAFCLISAKAEVVYLNNNLDTDASEKTFKTFQEAYDFANDSDTLYVIGSVHDYGAIEISKPIAIIGPGYFLDKNPITQVDKKAARFGEIEFFDGSEGSSIQGVVCGTGVNDEVIIPVSNITITNCYIYDRLDILRSDDANISNIEISRCYFATSSTTLFISVNYDGTWENFTFTNNIVNGYFSAYEGSSGIIMNNLFISSRFKPRASSSFQIKNNILLATSDTYIELPALPDAAISNNISVMSYFGTDNGNLEFIQASDIFVGVTENDSPDGQYLLNTSGENPAVGNASDGGNIGPFGGPMPYRLSGLPYLPNIYELSTSGLVSGDNLNVHIKIKQ